MTRYCAAVPVRNEENTLDSCVRSLLNQTITPSSVYICLNGENKPTREIAYGLARDSDLVKIVNSAPGKANAWNKLVATSESDLILFTDGDSMLPNDAAEKMIGSLRSGSLPYVTGGDILYMDPPHRFLLRPFFRTIVGKVIPVRNLHGASYMIKKGELLTAASKRGIDLLPPDTLNEDALIGAIARADNRYAKADTYVMMYPVTTLKEFYSSLLRVRKGYIQLENRYPELFYARQTQGVQPLSAKSFLELRREYGIPYVILRACMNALVDVTIRLTCEEQDPVWAELHTTKLR